jgi:hypothetical protein
MANKICDLLDIAEGKQSKICDDGCKNYRFDHLNRACVLSEVYSVDKGKPCYIYDPKADSTVNN